MDQIVDKLSRTYYFQNMTKIVKKVVEEYDICGKIKNVRHVPYGYL